MYARQERGNNGLNGRHRRNFGLSQNLQRLFFPLQQGLFKDRFGDILFTNTASSSKKYNDSVGCLSLLRAESACLI